MFLHLGNEKSVYVKNIIAILDIEKASTSKITREYLATAGKEKRVIYCSYDLPKSFVVTLDENFTEKVYVSSISCLTLKKRLNLITNSNIF